MSRSFVVLTASLFIVFNASTAYPQQPSNLKDLELSAGASTSRSEQLELARAYVDAGRFYEASKIAKRLLAVDPDDATAKELHEGALAGLKEAQNRQVAEAEAMAANKDIDAETRLKIADT